MKRTGLSAVYCFALAIASLGQPANDDFANRTPLIGNNLVFTGDLTGSTIEPNEPTNAPPWTGFPATRSVWWSWTATETTPVTIIPVAYSQDTYSSGNGNVVLAVYAGTNVFGPPSPATTTNVLWLDAVSPNRALSFQCVAGTTYQIQFFGTHPSLSVTFQLLATNPPVILDPPADQTVSPQGSALFTVIAAGLPPLTYQWQRNGVPIPGETNAMLALESLASDQAGDYSVVVASSTGSVIAGPASLVVNSNPMQPVLRAAGPMMSNSIPFSLAGEPGRYYRIESSTNLLSWQPEAAFPASPPALTYPTGEPPYRSVVYASSTNVVLLLPQLGSARFFRASLYRPANEACINRLREIRFAKELWLRSLPMPGRTYVPIASDLQPYLPGIQKLTCGAITNGYGSFQSSFTVNDVVHDPTCIIFRSHTLEKPRW
jgi:hypothetical protein